MQPPPVIQPYRPPQLPSPKPRNDKWQSVAYGSICLIVGILLEALGNPPVPFYQVFQLVPIGIGMGIGIGLLKLRYSLYGGIAVFVIGFLFLFYTFSLRCSIMPVLLFDAFYYYTIALVLWQREQA